MFLIRIFLKVISLIFKLLEWILPPLFTRPIRFLFRRNRSSSIKPEIVSVPEVAVKTSPIKKKDYGDIGVYLNRISQLSLDDKVLSEVQSWLLNKFNIDLEKERILDLLIRYSKGEELSKALHDVLLEKEEDEFNSDFWGEDDQFEEDMRLEKMYRVNSSEDVFADLNDDVEDEPDSPL